MSITRHFLATVPADDTELRVSLTWDRTDPHAVIMDLYPRKGPVRWVFAWSLLKDGVNGVAGLGDVRLCTVLDRTYILLESPEGRTVLQVATAELVAFLSQTIAEQPAIPDFIPADFFEANP